jgi:hypothetical protein
VNPDKVAPYVRVGYIARQARFRALPGGLSSSNEIRATRARGDRPHDELELETHHALNFTSFPKFSFLHRLGRGARASALHGLRAGIQ